MQATLLLWLLAYIFGMISPNVKINAEITVISNITPHIDVLEKPNMVVSATEKRTTIETLIKIFTIKMVASSLFGFSNNSNTKRLLSVSFRRILSICVCVNEKYAISEALNAADIKSRKISMLAMVIIWKVVIPAAMLNNIVNNDWDKSGKGSSNVKFTLVK